MRFTEKGRFRRWSLLEIWATPVALGDRPPNGMTRRGLVNGHLRKRLVGRVRLLLGVRGGNARAEHIASGLPPILA